MNDMSKMFEGIEELLNLKELNIDGLNTKDVGLLDMSNIFKDINKIE